MINKFTGTALILATTLLVTSCSATHVGAQVQKVEIVDGENAERRNLDDLRAQQQSALWTQIGALASIVGVAVSAVGLVFIYKQLRHSAAAVQEAAKSSEAAAEAAQGTLLMSRPWLKVDYAREAHIHERNSSPPRLVIAVTSTNVGATPAIDASTYAILLENSHQDALNEVIESFLAKEPRISETIFPNESSVQTGWNVDLTEPVEGFWTIVVLTSYRFSGSSRRHFSGVALAVAKLTHEAPDHFPEAGLLSWKARASPMRDLRVDAT